jgi:hypothetical protein
MAVITWKIGLWLRKPERREPTNDIRGSAGQGSMQSRGEGQELALGEMLKGLFACDGI